MTSRLRLAVFTLALAGSAAAQAQMLGETLTFQRFYPTIGTEFGPSFSPATVTVVAGSADDVSWNGSYLTVAPEDATITFVYRFPSEMIGDGPTFDGYAISGFSFSPAPLQVLSNSTGLALELSVIGDTLYIDMDNVHSPGQIVFGFAPVVPEPGTWALLAAGLAVVGAKTRRRA